MASLRLKGKHFCGAGLISWKFLLSAGLCINTITLYGGPNHVYASALLGTFNLSEGGIVYGVKEVKHHKDYYPNAQTLSSNYDIGLILVCL